MFNKNADEELKLWKEGDYFSSGMLNGQIIKKVHDSITVQENIGSLRWNQAPVQFFEGWYLSLSGKEFTSIDVFQCYKPN